ncbi:MAG: hypothetical protein A3B68_07625 [Candidatus Melainabacteria bacterium RIFCSPHIGHO2_02_FULL_34_12]|nr:MAG: hypothetical protein A3B68_07625 [Candidatus Melainabacteria bacterium RIFCSPHIGHO2_02_FULL_34_12]
MGMNIRFLLSSNANNLRQALLSSGRPTGTIEAEYGDEVVEGSHFTMAHHGPRAGQPAPCSYPNGFARISGNPFEGDVGLSHVDLDSLAGAGAVLERKPDADTFWRLAEFYDLSGLHKIKLASATDEDTRRLYAFLGWDSKNRVFPSQDGSISVITDNVNNGLDTIERIVGGNSELLIAGDDFRAGQDELNKSSFKDFKGGVILRESDKDVNHLYSTPNGDIAKVVVTFKPSKGKITLSFADPPKGKTAIEILRELFGQDAGGHASIAGTPRDQKFIFNDAVRTFDRAVESIKT